MEKLLIDTGAFFGREIQQDQHHETSMDGWSEIENSPVRLYSTEHIFDETLSILARRSSYAFAAEWGIRALQSNEIEWLSTEGKDLETALQLMRKYADQEVSFTDCVSFVLMRKEGIKHAFTFDRHFEAAQFRLWPGK